MKQHIFLMGSIFLLTALACNLNKKGISPSPTSVPTIEEATVTPRLKKRSPTRPWPLLALWRLSTIGQRITVRWVWISPICPSVLFAMHD
jgi:hypothetical protein